MGEQKYPGLYIEISDRLQNAVKERDLDYDKYRRLLKICAKGALPAVSVQDGALLLDQNHLARTLDDGYTNLYNQLSKDYGYKDLEEMIDVLTIEGLIKFDLFFYSIYANEQYSIYLIADVFPNSINYVPSFKLRDDPYFVDPTSFTKN